MARNLKDSLFTGHSENDDKVDKRRRTCSSLFGLPVEEVQRISDEVAASRRFGQYRAYSDAVSKTLLTDQTPTAAERVALDRLLRHKWDSMRDTSLSRRNAEIAEEKIEGEASASESSETASNMSSRSGSVSVEPSVMSAEESETETDRRPPRTWTLSGKVDLSQMERDGTTTFKIIGAEGSIQVRQGEVRAHVYI
eukprot:Rmarinus@m.5031